MVIETVNGSCWPTAQERISRLPGSVQAVLVQETKLFKDSLDAARDWARARGWKSVWSAALVGPNGGPSAGVAVLVREGLGLRDPFPVVPGRALAAVVDLPGDVALHLVAVYGVSADPTGLENLALLSAVGEWFQNCAACNHTAIAGGDWNLTPITLNLCGWATRAGVQLVAPSTQIGTCKIKKRRARVLDWFAVAGRAAAMVEAVDVQLDAAMSPHRPVRLTCRPEVHRLEALVLRHPPPLPRERVFGPMRRPPSYAAAARAARRAVEVAACTTSERDLRRALWHAHAEWARAAEVEIAGCGDTVVEKPGMRSREPVLEWRKVVPRRMHQQHPEVQDALARKWARDAVVDLRGTIELEDDIATAALASGLCGAADTWLEAGGVRELTQKLVAQVQASARVLAAEWAGSEPDGEDGDEVTSAADRRRRMKLVLDELGTNGEFDDSDEAVERARRRAWTDWAKGAVLGGARQAHTWTKDAKGWVPTSTVRAVDGKITADPQELAKAQGEHFAALWQASSQRAPWQPLPREDRRALRVPTPEEIRKAGRQFAAGTAIAADGFRVGHFAWLGDDALVVLAELWRAMELGAMVPPQWAHITLPLMEKKLGGFRAIAIFAAPVRLWGKMRRVECEQWEKQNDRIFFASAGGKSPLSPVWRAAVRAEIAVSDDCQAACALADVSAFFDSIDHSILMSAARRWSFDEVLLRTGLAIYAGPRHVKVGAFLAPTLFGRRGVVAGCALCTTLAKLYVLTPMDALVVRHPSVSWSIFVDDVSASVEGGHQQICDIIPDAIDDLEQEFSEKLRCPLAPAKTAVTATSKSLATRLATRLGISSASTTSTTATTTWLGADVSAGRRRSQWHRRSARGQRMRAAAARTKKVIRLRRAAGPRARVVAVAGLLPQASYAAEITGFDDAEWKKLRSLVAAGSGTYGRGRSLRQLMLVMGDPAAATMVSPVVRWASEIWDSTWAAPGSLRISQLQAAWCAAMRPTKPRWSAARGPAAVVRLTLERLGWQWPRAWELVSATGARYNLGQHPPALIKKCLIEATRRTLEIQVGETLRGRGWSESDQIAPVIWSSPCPPAGQRVCFDAAIGVLREKGISELEKGTLQAILAGATWTRTRLAAAGYEVDTTCPMCRSGEDTLHHRLWYCPASAALRDGLPKDMVSDARDAGEGSLLYTMGVMQHPAEIMPRPSDRLVDIWSGPGEGSRLDGDVYIDGSCDPHPVQGCSRASWAVAQVDEEGILCRALSGVVPLELPQTAPAAEYCALGAAAQVVLPSARLFGDCLNVVEDAHDFRMAARDPRKMYAGILRSIIGLSAAERPVVEIVKVKAHQDLRSLEGEALVRARGNAVADELAKAAMISHPSATPMQQLMMNNAWSTAVTVARHAARASALWPRSRPAKGERWQRRRRPQEQEDARQAAREVKRQQKMKAKVQARDTHQWMHWRGIQRCTWCLVRSDSAAAAAPCVGEVSAFVALGQEACSKGHQLWSAVAVERNGLETPVAVCMRCGGWAQGIKPGKPPKLSSLCVPPTRSGELVIARVRKSLFPQSGGGWKGIALRSAAPWAVE